MNTCRNEDTKKTNNQTRNELKDRAEIPDCLHS